MMMIVPKEEPALKGLNSSYINIPKLVEHCQKEFGSGFIHFRSPEVEGAIFFEKGRLLNGIFQNREKEVKGEGVIDSIVEAAVNDNLHVNIYKIAPEKIHFWTTLHTAQTIYQNLSTEFIDFEGLLRKMETEKLTGCVEVSINGGKESGIIFFENGKVIGGSYSWDEGGASSSRQNQELILKKTKELGGMFHVRKIPIPPAMGEHREEEMVHESPSGIIPMLEEFLTLFESEMMKHKKMKERFHTLLKNKFIEKADKYLFLNPFSDEFEYADQKISFSGKASDEELVHGVVESVKELAEELGLHRFLNVKLTSWAQKYQKELERLGLSF
jgi:hypothetical protein